jgi:polar amino acid transport system substrate-binding protein
MNRSFRLFALLIVLLVIPGLLVAQDDKVLSRVLKAGELRVGTSGAQPPFTAKTKQGTLMGYEIELAELLANAMGVRPKFVERPFAELMPALEAGEIDVIMSGMTMTPERNLRVAFIGPYIVTGKSILAKAKRVAELDEMDELNRPTITVAVLDGSTSERFVESIVPQVKLVPTKDYETAVNMVLSNEADAMVADYPICVLSMLRHPEAGLAVSDVPLTIEPIGIALPPGEFLMHNMIENYLKALDMTGVLQELEEKWFEDGAWLIRLP